MALVPAANGVESIAAAQGIQIVDTGANRFTVGLDVDWESGLTTQIPDGDILGGITTTLIAGNTPLDYTGPYIFTVRYVAGAGPGAIVAGPDDRLVVEVTESDTGTSVLDIPIPIYNRSLADVIPQTFSGMAMLTTRPDITYNVYLIYYNVSNTMVIPTAAISFRMYSLTSLRGVEPAPLDARR